MRTSFIVFGVLLFFWGLISLAFAVQDISAGISVKPRQEVAYAVAFLMSGGVLTMAGVMKYALNWKFVLGIGLLHAAVYSGGVVMEGLYSIKAIGPGVIVSGTLFIGGLVFIQFAHSMHKKGAK